MVLHVFLTVIPYPLSGNVLLRCGTGRTVVIIFLDEKEGLGVAEKILEKILRGTSDANTLFKDCGTC